MGWGRDKFQQPAAIPIFSRSPSPPPLRARRAFPPRRSSDSPDGDKADSRQVGAGLVVATRLEVRPPLALLACCPVSRLRLSRAVRSPRFPRRRRDSSRRCSASRAAAAAATRAAAATSSVDEGARTSSGPTSAACLPHPHWSSAAAGAGTSRTEGPALRPAARRSAVVSSGAVETFLPEVAFPTGVSASASVSPLEPPDDSEPLPESLPPSNAASSSMLLGDSCLAGLDGRSCAAPNRRSTERRSARTSSADGPPRCHWGGETTPGHTPPLRKVDRRDGA